MNILDGFRIKEVDRRTYGIERGRMLTPKRLKQMEHPASLIARIIVAENQETYAADFPVHLEKIEKARPRFLLPGAYELSLIPINVFGEAVNKSESVVTEHMENNGSLFAVWPYSDGFSIAVPRNVHGYVLGSGDYWGSDPDQNIHADPDPGEVWFPVDYEKVVRGFETICS